MRTKQIYSIQAINAGVQQADKTWTSVTCIKLVQENTHCPDSFVMAAVKHVHKSVEFRQGIGNPLVLTDYLLVF